MNAEYVIALAVAVALFLIGLTLWRRRGVRRAPFVLPDEDVGRLSPQEADRVQTFKTMDAEARRAWWRW